MLEESILKKEERAVFELRSLYRKFGYLPYKMSKFEEYDLYARNKDFLVSDGIITFTDTNGRLMALKPDVTLSIIRNYKDEPGCVQRVYYNESVYRISGETHEYKEIMQTGLECMGDVDFVNIIEVLDLAAESLDLLDSNFVLELSHMGIIAGLLKEADAGEDFNQAVAVCLDEKNAHELSSLCTRYGVADEVCSKLVRFIDIYGSRKNVIEELKPLCDTDELKAALQELKELDAALSKTKYSSHIKFDFSLVNDMKYYNGIVFQGYVENVPEVILSGGQYDRLMHRMDRKSRAIGFALYLDLLENLPSDVRRYDVDVVLLYENSEDRNRLFNETENLNSKGYSVMIQKNVPAAVRYRKLMKLTDKGVELIEDND